MKIQSLKIKNRKLLLKRFYGFVLWRISDSNRSPSRKLSGHSIQMIFLIL